MADTFLNAPPNVPKAVRLAATINIPKNLFIYYYITIILFKVFIKKKKRYDKQNLYKIHKLKCILLSSSIQSSS